MVDLLLKFLVAGQQLEHSEQVEGAGNVPIDNFISPHLIKVKPLDIHVLTHFVKELLDVLGLHFFWVFSLLISNVLE